MVTPGTEVGGSAFPISKAFRTGPASSRAALAPPSAAQYREWWSNEANSPTSHVQARSWMDVGWKVESVRLDAGQVRFIRDVEKTKA